MRVGGLVSRVGVLSRRGSSGCTRESTWGPRAAAGSLAMAGSEQRKHKAVTFGLVSDVQYADKEDKVNSRGITCAYRQSVHKLSAAVTAFNDASPPIDFVLHLGDLIGENPASEWSSLFQHSAGESSLVIRPSAYGIVSCADGNHTPESTVADLEAVQQEFRKLSGGYPGRPVTGVSVCGHPAWQRVCVKLSVAAG